MARPLASRGRYWVILLLRGVSLGLDVAVLTYFGLNYVSMSDLDLGNWNNVSLVAASFGILSNLGEIASLLDATKRNNIMPRNRISICGFAWADVAAFGLGLGNVAMAAFDGYFNQYHFVDYDQPWRRIFTVQVVMVLIASVVHVVFTCYLCCGVYKRISDRDRPTFSPRMGSRGAVRTEFVLEEVYEDPPPPPYSYQVPQKAHVAERRK